MSVSSPPKIEYLEIRPLACQDFGYRWYVRCRDRESGRIYRSCASPRFRRKREAEAFLGEQNGLPLFGKDQRCNPKKY